MTPSKSTDRIRETADILQVVGGYVNLQRRGARAEYFGLCPFHREQTPSFKVDTNKRRWHCFGCNSDGDAFDFIAKIEGTDFNGAKRRLAELAGFTLDGGECTREDVERWAAEKRAVQADLPAARFWRRAALALGYELLENLKAGLESSAALQPAPGEIATWTRQLARWRKIDGAELVAEFVGWRNGHPEMTGALVRAGAICSTTDVRALRKFLNVVEGLAA